METVTPIKLRNGFVSARGFTRCFLMGLGLMYLTILLAIPLSSIWRFSDWLLLVPVVGIAIYMTAGLFIPFLTSIYLESEQIRVVRFGLTVQSMPVSSLRLICITGNDRESVLCLSAYTVEELAQRREDTLRKGILTRDELPFRKRHGDWQGRFANEYLNQLCWKVLWSSPDKNLLWIPMEQTNVAAVRCMYPQIPFRNYEAPLDPVYHPDDVPWNVMQAYNCQVRPREDGIWLQKKNEDVWCLPAEQIKTIVRVDHLTAYNKYMLRHSVWLVASSHDSDELAAMCGRMPEGIDQLPVAKELRVIHICCRRANSWRLKTTDFCPMYHTASREAELRRLYPQAQWIDLSKLWMENSG